VEDFRNMGDLLGQTKNLGQASGSRPTDMIYGKPSGNKAISAADVMRGKYSPADLEPDRDLGKSITPGFRNLSLQDRTFGCPSIRSDIPHPAANRRSLADAQNYGDDVPAQELINPPAFSDLSIGPMAMNELRSKAKIFELFNRVGFQLDDNLAEELFFQASQGRGDMCTINAFRNVLNDYIIRKDLFQEKFK
jgi:EF-hand domain-containing family member B